jgi:hypothetical protein
MKITIGLALAAGLFLMVAGCATSGGGGAAPAGGTAAAAGGGAAAGTTTASAGGEIRNFNLEVKCPGVHYLKSKGWSDQQIVQQLSVEEANIPQCESWAASQPKGYVPPPPPGVAAAPGAPPVPAPPKATN